jgi:parallel beta-helix repeat protein
MLYVRLKIRRVFTMLKHIFQVFFPFYFAALFVGGNLYAKDVCRIVYGTWTKTDNPYNVTCSLLIPSGKTLTIKEGVKIYFKEELGIKVQGDLIIQGSSSMKVLLSSKDETNKERWNGINYESGGNLEIKHCLIDHATNALNVSSADSVKIDECSIEESDYAISVSNTRSLTIKQSLIKHTPYAIDVGKNVNEVVIDNCVITDCKIDVNCKSIITNNKIKGSVRLAGSNSIITGNTITLGEIYERADEYHDERTSHSGGISIYHGCHDNLIEGNIIETNYEESAIEMEWSSRNKIVGNNITKNLSGIWVQGDQHEILNNMITDNKGYGITLFEADNVGVFNNIIVGNHGVGIKIRSTKQGIKINKNEIHDNTESELDNDTSVEIDATNNWWGTTDESKITSRIFDYFQDATKGIVNFQPYLKAAPSHN